MEVEAIEVEKLNAFVLSVLDQKLERGLSSKALTTLA